MEEDDEIQAQASKFPRVGNGIRNESNNIGGGPRRGEQQNPDEELEDGDNVRRRGHQGSDGGSTNRFHTWHHSSRIIRVSRASGGKDRHSKVMTSKGLRDRRVRLSVATAIQFYDLQDRLGYDQPSKAVEWLIKSAADAIAELPSLNNTFPDTPKRPSDEKRGSEQGFDSADAELDAETSYHHQQQNNQSQNLSLSKSACSSTSETSKGSGLSLSRSDMRVKARERARERTAKEKEKESESHNNNNNIAHHHHHHQNVNPISQTASFTELLTGGISSTVPTTASPTASVHQNHHHHHHGGAADEPNNSNNLFNKANRNNWDYFSSGLLGPSSSSRTHHHNQSSSGFSQIQLGHSSIPEAMTLSAFNSSSSSDQLQMQHHFSFIPDHLMQPVVTSSSQPSDYNLNFTISSSGLSGYNRGTLQSNSPSHILPHLQRFSSPMDASTAPFFIGAAAPAPAVSSAAAAAATMENNHHHSQLQFSPVFDGRLQLYYSDGSRHSDQKGKAKN